MVDHDFGNPEYSPVRVGVASVESRNLINAKAMNLVLPGTIADDLSTFFSLFVAIEVMSAEKFGKA